MTIKEACIKAFWFGSYEYIGRIRSSRSHFVVYMMDKNGAVLDLLWIDKTSGVVYLSSSRIDETYNNFTDMSVPIEYATKRSVLLNQVQEKLGYSDELTLLLSRIYDSYSLGTVLPAVVYTFMIAYVEALKKSLGKGINELTYKAVMADAKSVDELMERSSIFLELPNIVSENVEESNV